MAEDSDLEKTEPASPRQLEKAREQGDVPRSREIGTFAVLAAAALGFWLSGEAMVRQLKHMLMLGLQFRREQLFDPQRLSVDWRQQLYDLFGSIPGCAVYESEANFVLVKMPPEIVVLLERELNARGMIVKFLKEPGFTDHARISLGNAEETDQLVGAIGSLLARPAVRTRAIGESA